MDQLNSRSHEQHQENSLFSSQSQIKESTDSRLRNTSNEVPEANRKCQSGLSTPYSSPLKTKTSSSLSGEMKLPVELDEGTTSVVIWDGESSTTSLQRNNVCCGAECNRTWIANSVGKFCAYVFYPPDWAEGWMAITDDRREALINRAGFKRKSAVLLFDAWCVVELVTGKIGHMFRLLKGQ